MKNLFSVITITLIMASCAPTRTIVDTSCPGYKSPDFEREDMGIKGIAIMPVLGGNEKEQFRRPMGDAITEQFRNEFGYGNVMSPNQVISILNNENLADEYAVALSNYKTTGIVPKELVSKLGKAFKVDYLLYTRLLADSEVGLITDGNSAELMNVDELYVRCQVWDTKIGDVAWEGKGGTAKSINNSFDIIQQTAIGLSKIVGNAKNIGPCETKQILFDSAQQAKAKSNWAWLGLSVLIVLAFL